jgi:phage terminase small subunit
MADDSIELKRVPEAPKGMNDVASAYWTKKCKDLKLMGRLTSACLENLQAYCNHLSDMQRAREMMDNAWSQPMFFKYQKAFIDANKQQLQLAKEFGFTPLSFDKLPSLKKDEPDPLAELNNARKSK